MRVAAILILGRDGYLAGVIFLALWLLACFSLITGRYLGRPKTLLSPELESKRVAIARKHNQIVGWMLLVLLPTMFALAIGFRHRPMSWLIVSLLALVFAEAYSILRLFKFDVEMCERTGFMCPRCGKPLYEPRGFISLTGKCPKCKESVLSESSQAAN